MRDLAHFHGNRHEIMQSFALKKQHQSLRRNELVNQRNKAMDKNTCTDCDTSISYGAERCKSCSAKRRWKTGSLKRHSKETRKKISETHKANVDVKHLKKAGRLGAAARWKGHKKATNKKTSRGKWTRSSDPRVQQIKKLFRNMRYRARKRGAEGSHTIQEWFELKKFYGNMCLCCKRTEPKVKLSEDHIIPLSKGGSDYIDNIQPLCVSCNTRKHARVIDYTQQKGGETFSVIN